MSSVPLQLPLVTPLAPAVAHVDPTAIARRRPSRQQGAALEMIGHAIEYLIDEHGYEPQESPALAILMRASCDVFQECEEIVPFGARLRRRLRPLLG